MKKIEITTETYDAGNGFFVDIVKKPNAVVQKEAWLYHKDCQEKKLMFGIQDMGDALATYTVENYLDEHIAAYRSKFMNTVKTEGEKDPDPNDYKTIVTERGWFFSEQPDGMLELSIFTPAGEDFSITIPNDDRKGSHIREYGFDVDEHVRTQLESGTENVPDVKTLVKDAIWIEQELKYLSDLLDGKQLKTYNVLYAVHGYYPTSVQATSTDMAEDLAETDFSDADFGELSDLEGEIIRIEAEE